MKRPILILAIVLYFLLVNTENLWISKLGIWGMLSFLFLSVFFLVLFSTLIVQLFYCIKEKFKDKQRLFTILVLALVLFQSIFYPKLIDFTTIGRKSVMIANTEGVANCITTLELFDDYSFRKQSHCFGTSEIKGNYYIEGDTLYFKDISLGRDENDFYSYAVVSNYNLDINNFKGNIILYKTPSDTLGYSLGIVKNSLFK
jgi:hypothetical protein